MSESRFTAQEMREVAEGLVDSCVADNISILVGHGNLKVVKGDRIVAMLRQAADAEDELAQIKAQFELWKTNSQRAIDALSKELNSTNAKGRCGMTINDIPKVALLDANEKELDEGYFFKYPEHMGPGIYNGAPPKIPDVLGYITYDQGDWGMANMPRFRKVTPPHHFKVKPTDVMKANAYYLRQCAALFRQNDPDRCSQLEDIAKWLDGGEK